MLQLRLVLCYREKFYFDLFVKNEDVKKEEHFRTTRMSTGTKKYSIFIDMTLQIHRKFTFFNVDKRC